MDSPWSNVEKTPIAQVSHETYAKSGIKLYFSLTSKREPNLAN
jgi:hypothetical protein